MAGGPARHHLPGRRPRRNLPPRLHTDHTGTRDTGERIAVTEDTLRDSIAQARQRRATSQRLAEQAV